ncbi:MAG: CGNR zinc finger domain-containing protein [Roseitalea sp.]|jgi:predicted RNA-binding Zn ribbon-like protein|nr:CGNR zinc finger domain-containing protein [Roseitalea sp.]MBO6721037.1 CGNR zinc finger domain-containing protein [Roseitalea sp.]MBO6742891.1 CGNR zinc finger domain-containing protein [Roseitalea sp.]
MKLDSYIDAGVLASVEFANKLTPGYANGRPVTEINVLEAVREVVAIDPPSVAAVSEKDADGFIALAEQLRAIFIGIDGGDMDDAAEMLNRILSEHPATPYLAKEEGVWHLHHHPADAALLPMWTAICAEGLARMIGTQNAHRLGICTANNCDRVFADTSKNATRRFCSSACQNRTKMAAFRARKRAAAVTENKP